MVEYEKFVSQPDEIIKKIYEELQEPAFEHDINNVIYDEPDYDAHFGMPGLHKVQQKVNTENVKAAFLQIYLLNTRMQTFGPNLR